VKLPRHRLLCLSLFSHGLLKFPSQHAFYDDGFNFLSDSFLFEETVEG
jgi:hypothetical protein